jgi:hypothetical protein
MLLQKVIKGRQARPRRVLLYGTHGIGKSTWASQAPNPLFLATEDGLCDIGCDRTPVLTNTLDVAGTLLELTGEQPHQWQTVVIDTVDWLERLVWKSVCEKAGKESIEEIGYGKGYVLAISKWEWLLKTLDACRDRGMNVILLGHARIERFTPPDGEPYDRWQLDIHKTASQLIQEWADEVLFATYRVHTIQKDDGFNRKRTRAVGDGERIVYTSEHPTHAAKRRIEMPDTLPMTWAAYYEHWPHATVAGGNIAGLVTDGHSSKKKEASSHGTA